MLIGGMRKTKRADWCTCGTHYSTARLRRLQNNLELKRESHLKM